MPPRRPSAALLSLLLVACAGAPVQKPVNGDRFSVGEVAQSDANRVANLVMRDNLDSLALLLDKLYRRNPAEWKKSGAASREAAVRAVMTAVRDGQPLPALGQARSVGALPRAFDAGYGGDRAGALIYGLGTMLTELYGGRRSLYLVNGLDAQRVANASFNVQVAVWMLSNRTGPDGKPLLLSNEIGLAGSNLSFEREFGRVIGRLELLAELADESTRRGFINYVQGLLGAPLLQFLPLDAVSAVK